MYSDFEERRCKKGILDFYQAITRIYHTYSSALFVYYNAIDYYYLSTTFRNIRAVITWKIFKDQIKIFILYSLYIMNKGGKSRSRKGKRRGSRGGSMMARTLQKVIVPFGLFLASKRMSTRKRGKSGKERGRKSRRR